MSAAAPTHDPSTLSRPSMGSLLLGWVSAAVGALIAASVVAFVARALGVPDERQLMPATYIPFVIIGTLAGAVGWFVILRRSTHPRATLGRLVPIVLVVTFVPDVLLGVAGTPWSAVVTLVLMHLAVALAALPLYARFMPPNR